MEGFDLGFVPQGSEPLGNDKEKKKKKKKKSKGDDPFDFSEGGGAGSGFPDSVGAGGGFANGGMDIGHADNGGSPTARGRQVSFEDSVRRAEDNFTSSRGDRDFGKSRGDRDFQPSFGGGFSGGDRDRFEDSEFSGRREAAGRESFGREDFGRNQYTSQTPSVLAEALGRAADRTHDLNVASFGSDPGAPRRIDAFSTARDGAPYQSSFRDDANFPTSFGDAHDTGRPLERGFSFSLNDMPYAPVSSSGSPYYVGSGPGLRDHLNPAQKWNPLDGISRHWNETSAEMLARPVSASTPLLSGGQDSGMILPASLSKRGTVQEELSKSEARVQALRTKISSLDANLNVGAKLAEGHLRIVMPHPLDGGTLGVTLKDMVVVAIPDSRAFQFGWAVGDRVLQVNGFPVCNSQEYAKELSKAMSSYQTMAKPMVFDIWRQPLLAAGVHGGGMTGASVFHTNSSPTQPKYSPRSRRRTICGESHVNNASPGSPVGSRIFTSAPVALLPHSGSSFMYPQQANPPVIGSPLSPHPQPLSSAGSWGGPGMAPMPQTAASLQSQFKSQPLSPTSSWGGGDLQGNGVFYGPSSVGSPRSPARAATSLSRRRRAC